ncbi:hypothetical protein [Nocardioides mangrovi]|uniref:Uncharacterized protein n=1 Tax=Nocardioides mangrovi TaxID=2874580 RepID=A0ABS7UBP7_9ACTN|nr:hypothetical protein [Nocardioides mangrovi]MBZ5738423.1 hypothetical protein [Nocardioides mangrovi]
MRTATHAPRIYWFVVCSHTRIARVDGAYVPVPDSVAHAKQMGSSLTACGKPVGTWTRLFEIAFPSDGENCADCLAAVTPRR